jgi:hypothetical protein
MIPEPNVAKMIETHSKVDIATIKVNNQVAIIQVQVGKNIIEDVLLDGRASVNIIIENLKKKKGLLKLRPTPYHLKMQDQSMTKPLGIIKNIYMAYHIYSHLLFCKIVW